MKLVPELTVILLGSESVGKNLSRERRLWVQTGESRNFVDKTEIIHLDTPGWWKGFAVLDTPEAIKEELMRSVFLSPPGPHVFLPVIQRQALECSDITNGASRGWCGDTIIALTTED